MLVHRAFTPLQTLLPNRIGRSVRGLATAILTPFYFAFSTGHFRSSLRSKALDPTGRPIPWYTYPAIEFLRTKKFGGRRILEFGSGQSTLWWAGKAEAVISFEDNGEWFNYVHPQLPANTELHLTDSHLSSFESVLREDQTFDVIVIDGLNRFVAASKSFERLAPGGVILLDNSEGYWGPTGSYPIIDLLHAAGFQRVDFYGFSPGTILQHCTSFFFREDCFLFNSKDHPVSLGTLRG